MKWAIAQGYRADNPAGDAITQALPKVRTRVQHQRALPHAEVGAAVAQIRAADAYVGARLVLEFLILTAVRSGEARAATWDEIDGTTWTIPAERTKSRRESSSPTER